jgi:hypothetical protein
MTFNVRLFLQDSEKPPVHIGAFNSPTPQIGDSIKVPVGKSITVGARVVGVFRSHHSEPIDVVDAYEEPPERPVL